MSGPLVLRPAECTPDADVVELLEDLLQRARAGQVLELAVVGVLTGAEVLTATAGEPNVFPMLGALRVLEQRLVDRVER